MQESVQLLVDLGVIVVDFLVDLGVIFNDHLPGGDDFLLILSGLVDNLVDFRLLSTVLFFVIIFKKE